ncbi:hypothetical protein GQ44DRAFT_627590 [Phaeosphaeriaceae sp. PMI808]|nr:hypothetical protein GQ44DRAFT_627590 [Phaeosphaeriaceae sp. PMI808]
MSGRILPVALATIVSISIGIATFDQEFKEQRRKRLEEEYNREVAAASHLANQSLTTMETNNIPPLSPEQLYFPQMRREQDTPASATSSASSWSSMLGLWAWKKDNKKESSIAQKPVSAQKEVDEASGKPWT